LGNDGKSPRERYATNPVINRVNDVRNYRTEAVTNPRYSVSEKGSGRILIPFLLCARYSKAMLGFLLHVIVVAAALYLTAMIVPGVTFSSWPALAVAAVVLGFVNAVVRPILVILTLPITVLTLGLFYLIVNAMAFGLAAALVPGFSIASWTAAILGALVTSIISWFIGIFVKRD
jgi:putative membrane protein